MKKHLLVLGGLLFSVLNTEVLRGSDTDMSPRPPKQADDLLSLPISLTINGTTATITKQPHLLTVQNEKEFATLSQELEPELYEAIILQFFRAGTITKSQTRNLLGLIDAPYTKTY